MGLNCGLLCVRVHVIPTTMQKCSSRQRAKGQKFVTYLLLILFCIFINMQFRCVACHQSEKFADGIRREALPSSRLKDIQEEISKLFGEKSVYISLGKWLVSIS